MKTIGNVAAVTSALLLIGAIGFGVYLAIDWFVGLFTSLTPEVANVTAIACVVALVSALAIARAITTAGREATAMVCREEKTTTYQLLLDLWASVLGASRAQTPLLQPDPCGKLEAIERLLAVYGSTAVIEAHMALRGAAGYGGHQHPEVRVRLSEMLIAVRNDLGTDAPDRLADRLVGLLLPAQTGGGRPAEARGAAISVATT